MWIRLWTRLWTLPMNLASALLVKISGCTQDSNGDWFAPRDGWLDRLLHRWDLLAFTPGWEYIIFRSDVKPTIPLWLHEFAHADQHQKYGPFFVPVYAWCSLVSWFRGTGWYLGNQLEVEARFEVEEAMARK